MVIRSSNSKCKAIIVSTVSYSCYLFQQREAKFKIISRSSHLEVMVVESSCSILNEPVQPYELFHVDLSSHLAMMMMMTTTTTT